MSLPSGEFHFNVRIFLVHSLLFRRFYKSSFSVLIATWLHTQRGWECIMSMVYIIWFHVQNRIAQSTSLFTDGGGWRRILPTTSPFTSMEMSNADSLSQLKAAWTAARAPFYAPSMSHSLPYAQPTVAQPAGRRQQLADHSWAECSYSRHRPAPLTPPPEGKSVQRTAHCFLHCAVNIRSFLKRFFFWPSLGCYWYICVNIFKRHYS